MGTKARDKGRTGGSTPAILALQAAGISFSTHAFESHDLADGYGLQAARQLGLDPQWVFKTLLTDVDGSPTVAIVPVAGTLDLKLLAAACSGRRAQMLEPAIAQRLTGYVVGGISPIGLKRPLPTVLDDSVHALTTVYVSGGRRGLDIGLAPRDLIQITSARCAPLARRRQGNDPDER